MTSLRTCWIGVLAATAHCGSAVTPRDAATDMSIVTDAVVTDTPIGIHRSCAEVQSTCTTAPETFVRGHASGLTGLEGARVQFAMRYLLVDGAGLAQPHGVVSEWGTVRDGSFEACVCLPRAANEYPEVAAVVFAPETTGTTSREVARASYSQRYATLGDEDVSYALRDPPTPALAEAALAAMSDRAVTITLHSFEMSAEGQQVIAGLVADERPVAAELARGGVSGSSVALPWLMPGIAYSSERIALLVDVDGDGRCGGTDRGAFIPTAGSVTVSAAGAPWLQSAALTPICDALALLDSRQR